MSIELDAGIAITLGDQIERLCKMLERLYTLTDAPRFRRIKMAKTSAASAAAWMFFDVTPGGVPTGRVFDVRNLSVCADDPSAQLAGTAVIAFKFFGHLPSDGATCPTDLNIVNPGYNALIPVTSTYRRLQCTLQPSEHLGVGVKGLGNGVNVHVNGQMMDWGEADVLPWLAP